MDENLGSREEACKVLFGIRVQASCLAHERDHGDGSRFLDDSDSIYTPKVLRRNASRKYTRYIVEKSEILQKHDICQSACKKILGYSKNINYWRKKFDNDKTNCPIRPMQLYSRKDDNYYSTAYFFDMYCCEFQCAKKVNAKNGFFWNLRDEARSSRKSLIKAVKKLSIPKEDEPPNCNNFLTHLFGISDEELELIKTGKFKKIKRCNHSKQKDVRKRNRTRSPPLQLSANPSESDSSDSSLTTHDAYNNREVNPNPQIVNDQSENNPNLVNPEGLEQLKSDTSNDHMTTDATLEGDVDTTMLESTDQMSHNGPVQEYNLFIPVEVDRSENPDFLPASLTQRYVRNNLPMLPSENSTLNRLQYTSMDNLNHGMANGGSSGYGSIESLSTDITLQSILTAWINNGSASTTLENDENSTSTE
ncbi:hypothetical protein RF11_06616 [Thelohanellus kitauei]|uniref:Uncharacterized protein n=1 Tax=Thelohanellus kitauei TaxID=669202 RepID=A0A0C2MUQ0_THEKT|nr:hypothetical protein RF11_05235 [Thelohanellus kitauei]KII67040.1 hypothetical protein RF11_06616 [Thelohanellus kitauei]